MNRLRLVRPSVIRRHTLREWLVRLGNLKTRRRGKELRDFDPNNSRLQEVHALANALIELKSAFKRK